MGGVPTVRAALRLRSVWISETSAEGRRRWSLRRRLRAVSKSTDLREFRVRDGSPKGRDPTAPQVRRLNAKHDGPALSGTRQRPKLP